MRSGFQTSGKRILTGAVSSHQIRFSNVFVQSFLLGAWLAVASTPAFSASDYLSELDAEAAKVEATGGDSATGEDPGETGSAVSTSPENSSTASRKAFERYLKKHYLGSYGFYRKLPERSRQEVFQEYREGADIYQLRRKIINRLLQH